MSTETLTVREATLADTDTLVRLVRTAYRGDVGWTTESGLLDDERIDTTGMARKISEPDGAVLVGLDSPASGRVVACCEVVHRGAGLAYFGMFAVDPALQAAGLGRLMLSRAEDFATDRWGAHTMEMTVIAQRDELINWYERRGYTVTDAIRPFPYDELVGGGALRDDLFFRVLVKPLVPGVAGRTTS
ncbi:GNAT family N-acetyltransferase [Dermatophilaceae bacterium Soc4.6]